MSPNPFSTPNATSNLPQTSRPISLAGWMVVLFACGVSVFLRFTDATIGNLSSIVALSLFCGTVFRNRAGWLLPLGIRLLTDVAIHLKTGYGFFASWPFDYSAYLLIYAFGILIPATRKWSVEKRFVAVAGSSIVSVLIYFALSNFGVWLLWPDTYPRTVTGLVECFTLAIPFAKGTIAGNLVAAPVFYTMWYSFASQREESTAGAPVATVEK